MSNHTYTINGSAVVEAPNLLVLATLVRDVDARVTRKMANGHQYHVRRRDWLASCHRVRVGALSSRPIPAAA
jgi:hypothetical protein